MSSTPQPILELLAARAIGDLDASERTEIDRYLVDEPALGHELESMEFAVAAATVASLGRRDRLEPLDASLRDRILSAVAPVGSPEPAAPPLRLTRSKSPAPSAGPSLFGVAGWLAAAACLTLAVIAWVGTPAAPADDSLAQARQQLIDSAGDAVTLSWGDWALNGEAPEIAGVTGDVVWSESLQKGYLRFVGLPQNDPTREQYQLWIVDGRGLADATGQSARISGAIFDAASGETIIPIDPAIPVDGAALFAVTIEAPGGVWVSDMTRRVTVAARG